MTTHRKQQKTNFFFIKEAPTNKYVDISKIGFSQI